MGHAFHPAQPGWFDESASCLTNQYLYKTPLPRIAGGILLDVRVLLGSPTPQKCNLTMANQGSAFGGDSG